MDIDLGQSARANVKVGGESYMMRLPTVLEAEKFQDEIKKDEHSSLKVFMALVIDLGLPEDVAKTLDVHQFTKLSEGLMGMAEKK